MHFRAVVCAPCLVVVAAGCGGVMGSGPAGSGVPEPAGDPTPLAKCRVAASESNPLVTEWPASEKAHLQSLTGRQAVAVEYAGCELRLIPDCQLPGTYSWQRTTLATDTVEIQNADELYAKLPIGAVGLEAELERSGRLAVQTTVAGQLRLDSAGQTPPTPACRRATHVVSGISVGTFKLISGAEQTAGGGVGAMGAGAGVRQSGGKSVLRTAGDPASCTASTDEQPHVNCASPIQLFLTRLDLPAESAAPSGPRRAAVGPSEGVEISFPAPEDAKENWTVRDADGGVVCVLPCTTRVPMVSGYTLRRERPLAELPLPGKLPLQPGTRAVAHYQAERGSPVLSKLGLYFVGLPTAGVAVGFGIWGATQYNATCEGPTGVEEECFPGSGFLWMTAAMMGGIAVASYWWFDYSQESELDLMPEGSAKSSSPGPTFMIGPGSVYGTF